MRTALAELILPQNSPLAGEPYDRVDAERLAGVLKALADRLAEAGPSPSLFVLFGKGYLAITFDQAATARSSVSSGVCAASPAAVPPSVTRAR